MTSASSCRRRFLLFGIAAGVSGPSISQDAAALRKKATEEMQSGDWSAAFKLLLSLPRGSLRGNDYYALALCSYNLDRPADALRYSSLAISTKSLSPIYNDAANRILRAAAGEILSPERITARYGMSNEEAGLNAEKAAESERLRVARMRDEVEALLSAQSILGRDYSSILHVSKEIRSGMPDEGLRRLFDDLAKSKPQSISDRAEPFKLPIPK